jgi:hypothetical protein
LWAGFFLNELFFTNNRTVSFSAEAGEPSLGGSIPFRKGPARSRVGLLFLPLMENPDYFLRMSQEFCASIGLPQCSEPRTAPWPQNGAKANTPWN